MFFSRKDEEAIDTSYLRLDEILMHAVKANNGVLDEQAYKENKHLLEDEFYYKHFMPLYLSQIPTQPLFNLTVSIMQHHHEYNRDADLLRGTGLITGPLYIELAKRCKYNPTKNYDPSNPNSFNGLTNNHELMNTLNYYVYQNIHRNSKAGPGGVASTIVLKINAEVLSDEAVEANITPADLMRLAELSRERSKVQQELSEEGKHQELCSSIINENVNRDNPPIPPAPEYFQQFEARDNLNKLLSQIDMLEKIYRDIEIKGKIGRRRHSQPDASAPMEKKDPPKKARSEPSKSIQKSKNEDRLMSLQARANAISRDPDLSESQKHESILESISAELDNQLKKYSDKHFPNDTKGQTKAFFKSKRQYAPEDIANKFIEHVNSNPKKHHYTRLLAMLLRNNGAKNDTALYINPPTDAKIQEKYHDLMVSCQPVIQNRF